MLEHKRRYNLGQKESATLIIRDFNENKKLCLSNKDKREIFGGLELSLRQGKFNSSINYFVLGILYQRERIFDDIKRRGIFRYSKYLGTRCIVSVVCKELLSLASELGLSWDETTYLQSILNLSPIHQILNQKRLSIIKVVKGFKDRPVKHGHKVSFIRTLLVFIDFLFYNDYYPSQRTNPNLLNFCSKETVAEAISYIIYIYSDVFKLAKDDFGIIDEDYIISGNIEQVVLDAYLIKRLQEFEIYIDHFSYKCLSKGKTLVIEAPFPKLEKAIRLGYARNELQALYDYRTRDDLVSLEQLCSEITDELGLALVKLVNSKPYPRYRIEFPISVQKTLCEQFLNSDRIFREEEQYFGYIAKEQLIRLSDLLNTKIRKNLTVFEFIKIKRYFVFLFLLIRKKFTEESVELALILRSLVPDYSSSERLVQTLTELAPKEKIESFLDIVTWKPEQDIVLDLQYQSFVNIGGYCAIPICIFAKSNTVRNLFSLEYKMHNPEVHDEGEFDPISEMLSESFEKQGFDTYKRIKHSFGKGGEIDFIAIKDELLFVAECKRILLPTNIFELRTLYDEILKATAQLNTIAKAINDPRSSAEIGDKIGHDIGKIKRFQTAIITNNRVFAGISLSGHPIRNVQELINIVETGIIKIKDADYCVWKGDTFSAEDLFWYFSEEGLNRHSLDAMTERELIYRFQSLDIKLITYYLNTNKALGLLRDSNYRRIS